MPRLNLVIIPCVGLDELLLWSLRGCLSLVGVDYRIIILPDLPITLPANISSPLIEIVPTGAVTIAAKRNRAIERHPEAACYALIDSDASPDPCWLARSVSILAECPDILVAGGPNIPPADERDLQRPGSNALKSALVSGPLAFAKAISPSRNCSTLHSCNMILPRRAIDKIGLFKESLFTGEDRNFCDRARAAGGRIFFSSEIIVYHQSRSLWKPFMRQRFTYGHGTLGVAAEATSHRNLLLFLPSAWLLVFLTLIIYDLMRRIGMPLSPIVAAACIFVSLLEAIRHATRTSEIPRTFAALILSYFATTAGQITALCRLPLNLKQIYIEKQT